MQRPSARVNLIFSVILMCPGFCLAHLEVAYQWKYINYTWKSDYQREEAIRTGNYDYTKIITNDIQPLPDGRVIVTTPKYFDNPASLSTISDKTCIGGPLLAPYPDWGWHMKKDCSGITSVNRVILDDYERLWLVDSGKIGNRRVCQPKILAFDISTDELIREIKIPNELSHNPKDRRRGELEISAVETSGDDSERIWVYIADLLGYGFLIWNGNEIWRLNDDVFIPDVTDFSIAGVNFTQGLGPSVSAITPKGFLRKPALIFKPIADIHSHAVTLEDLHNSYSGFRPTYYRSNASEPSQELSRDFSKKGGILVVAFSTETAIWCWNLQNLLQLRFAVTMATDETTLQFVSAIKITLNADGVGQTLWSSSNRYQNFVTGIMNFHEINFRILKADLDSMVKGTVCEPRPHEIVNGIEDKVFLVEKP